ncbi:MAG: hypothetical protein P4L50_07565 [Anaerolineaceae bacterium]|nr:hypothetical protein [Anaerolineaceae bacterium]
MAKNVQTLQHLLRVHGMTLILGLIVQYILGMFTNLYVVFPKTSIPGQLWEFAWSQASEASHIILGILLFIGTLVLFIRALVYKNRTWTIAAGGALAGVLVAIYGGVSFIPTQMDPYSLLMSVAFIVSLLALLWGFYTSKEQP